MTSLLSFQPPILTGRAAPGSRIQLFDIEFDPIGIREAADRILDWTSPPREGCRFVVTPNVDHVVMLQSRDDLRAAYADAALVLADGQPVVWASRWLGKPLPERAAGSDLVPAVFDAACHRAKTGEQARPLRVFLLGALPGVGNRAAAQIVRQWPAVEVCGVYSPPLGFERDDAENARILEQIAAAETDLVLVGLGAPKQELWVHRHHRSIHAAAALCIGATIDFLAGDKPRAPRWMRRCGLEWLHRLASEPRRLAARYLRDAWTFPRLVAKEWWQDRSPTSAPSGGDDLD